MKNKSNNKKEKIVKILSEPMPSSKIAARVKMNYHLIEPILEELLEQKLIKIERVKNGRTYWIKA